MPPVVDRHDVVLQRVHASGARDGGVRRARRCFRPSTQPARARCARPRSSSSRTSCSRPDADVRSFLRQRSNLRRCHARPHLRRLCPRLGLRPSSRSLPAAGRAGILGQAAVLAGHSKPDHSSPTRRGVFILQSVLCTDAATTSGGRDHRPCPIDPTLTTRQKLELIARMRRAPVATRCSIRSGSRSSISTPSASIARRRTGSPSMRAARWMTWPSTAQRSSERRCGKSPTRLTCLLRNFYRSVNGRTDDDTTRRTSSTWSDALGARGYVWRDLVADFVASDAFRSAPALPVTQGAVIMEILKKLSVSRRFALQGAARRHRCVAVAADARRHVQRQRHRLRPGRAVADLVRHLLLGQRYPSRVALDPERDGRRQRLAAPDEPPGFCRPEGRHDVRHRPRHDGRRVQGTRLGRRVRARGRRRHDRATSPPTSASRSTETTRNGQRRRSIMPTIDQLIADAIHTNEPFKSLETGMLPFTGINMGTVSQPRAPRPERSFAARTRSRRSSSTSCSAWARPTPGARRTSRTRCGAACSTRCWKTRTA